MKPTFQHDCDSCIFLGHFKNHDVYFCPRSNGGSLLARFGDDGPDYASTPVSLLPHTLGNPEIRAKVEYVQAWAEALKTLTPLVRVLASMRI